MNLLVFLLTVIAFVFAVCTIGLSLLLIIIKIVKKDWHKLITFLGNYKKGVFSLTYVAVFFIQLANRLFIDNTLTLSGIFNVINNTINSFVLNINFNELEVFSNHSTFYMLSVRIIYIIVLINLFLFIISIGLPFILRFIKRVNIKKKKDCVIFIGYNDKTKEIIKTINKSYSFMIIDKFSQDDKINLMKNIYYFHNINENKYKSLDEELFKLIRKLKMQNVYVIINKNNNDNLIFTKEVSDLIEVIEKNKLKYNMDILFLGTCACDYSPLLKTTYKDAFDKDYISKFGKTILIWNI